MLNVHHIEKRNYVNGNGARYVIWCQGCNLGCKDCWNKSMWSFNNNKLMTVEQLITDIKSVEGISGVTFTGGEPFLQVEELTKLSKIIKDETHMNIQIFTGYELSELNDYRQKELLKYTDILVTGRFDKTKENNNQKVYNLKNEKWDYNNTDIEIDIDDAGELTITGYPSDKFIKDLKGDINERIYN